MCKDCMIELRPERHRTCLDNGHYLLNFKACASCNNRSALTYENKTVEEEGEGEGGGGGGEEEAEEEYEEITNFDHACSKCSHVVAHHFHSFVVNEKDHRQTYMMECMLCGRGVDHVRIPTPGDSALHAAARVGGLVGAEEEKGDASAAAAAGSTQGGVPEKEQVQVVTLSRGGAVAGAIASAASKQPQRDEDDDEDDWD